MSAIKSIEKKEDKLTPSQRAIEEKRARYEAANAAYVEIVEEFGVKLQPVTQIIGDKITQHLTWVDA